MAGNKVSDTVNDMVNSMVEDINSAQNGSNKVSAIKDNVGYDMSRVHSANLTTSITGQSHRPVTTCQ